MALNALEIDPGTLWKGAWRWYDESMLGCCVELEEVKANGITWDEWLCVVRCQGVSLKAQRADDAESTLEGFRERVRTACASSDSVLVVSYSRKEFSQTGDGHYSPIGAYVAESDTVLIMDVARFKHPPHYVPLERLWEAMLRPDPTTARSRGFATLTRPCHARPDSLITLTFGRGRVQAARRYFASEVGALVLKASATTAEEELWVVARGLPAAVASLVSLQPPGRVGGEAWSAGGEAGEEARNGEARGEAEARAARLDHTRAELTFSRTHVALAEADAAFRKRDGPLPTSVAACAALFLAVPHGLVSKDELCKALPHAGPLMCEELGGGREGSGAFAVDVTAARAALADMLVSVERACALEDEAKSKSCCAAHEHLGGEAMHHP